jgi:hypothetical protein
MSSFWCYTFCRVNCIFLTKLEQTYRKKLQWHEKNNAPVKMISPFKVCLRNTNSRMRETNKTQLDFLLKTIDLKIVAFLQKIQRFQVILLRQLKVAILKWPIPITDA